MKKINTYIIEKFKISKDIKSVNDFYIFVPKGDICAYCRKEYKNNHYNGSLTWWSNFDWNHVFVLYWEDIIDIFRYFKHNLSYEFSLDRFLIYDIKNIDEYESIEDFLDNVKIGNVSSKNFKYNEKYAEELDETIK